MSNEVPPSPVASDNTVPELRPLPPTPIGQSLSEQQTNQIKDEISQFDDTLAPVLPPRNERALPELPPRQEVVPERELKADDMLLYRINETINQLKSIGKYTPVEEQTGEASNKSVWTQIIESPERTITNEYETIEEMLMSEDNGIPDDLRRDIWKSITFNKSHDWGTIYELLMPKDCPFDEEKVRTDIKTLIGSGEEEEGSIFNIIKCYLNFDPEVEYTQDLITLILIIMRQQQQQGDGEGPQGSEDIVVVEIFGTFCSMMKLYSLREFYLTNEFNELKRITFQFDRLIEDHDVDLYNHLLQQGIKSGMYMIDWIKTLFHDIDGVDFSLQIRVIDCLFFYGIESLLSLACYIMIRNKDQLISMEYDELVVVLKEGKGLFSDDEMMRGEWFCQSLNRGMIRPNLFKSYCEEYDAIYSGEQAMRQDFQKMQIENKELTLQIKTLEHDYTMLNREHVTIANELLQNQIKINNIQRDNSTLKLDILELQRRVAEQIEENNKSNAKTIPHDLKKDLDETLKKNSKVMQRNLIYQDKINELERIYNELQNGNEKGIYLEHLFVGDGDNSRTPLIGSTWTGFKKVFQ